LWRQHSARAECLTSLHSTRVRLLSPNPTLLVFLLYPFALRARKEAVCVVIDINTFWHVRIHACSVRS
jgi:hypothetical protein